MKQPLYHALSQGFMPPEAEAQKKDETKEQETSFCEQKEAKKLC
jgi:hypothetical protein